MEDAIGTKFEIVSGYVAGSDIDLAVERGEVMCRAFTDQRFFTREPFITWRKKNFVRVLYQTGSKRDPRLKDVPLFSELMDKYKTPENVRRLAKVVVAADEFGRPMVFPPAYRPTGSKSSVTLSTRRSTIPRFWRKRKSGGSTSILPRVRNSTL